MTVENRYFRDSLDQWRVNGLNARKLITSLGAIWDADFTTGPASTTYYLGIRVWRRSSGGVETEITSGTPVAVVQRDALGEGWQVGTWTCPLTSLDSTDSIVVRTYMKIGAGGWVLSGTWTTEQLGAQSLDNVAWSVHYYTILLEASPAAWEWYFSFGDVTHGSYIEGFTWTPAPPPVALWKGDGLIWIS